MKKVLEFFTILSVLFVVGSILPGYSKATNSVQAFKDVPNNHYYYQPIYSLYGKQAVNGYVNVEGDSYFKPFNTVTR